MTSHEPLTEQEKYQEFSFNKKAGRNKIYAMTGGRDNRNHNIKIRAIVDSFALGKNNRVLEVGVGEGEHAYWCLKHTDMLYTGIDISQKALQMAEKRLQSFPGRYSLKKDNANKLSFDDNSFEAVFCAATLHHMKDPFLMIAEMGRVLKPGGRIALMEPNWIYPTNMALTLLLKEDRSIWLMRRHNFYRWLEKAGLKEIQVENLLYTPPVPKFMIPGYNLIDSICSKVPVIKRCSLMLFGQARK